MMRYWLSFKCSAGLSLQYVADNIEIIKDRLAKWSTAKEASLLEDERLMNIAEKKAAKKLADKKAKQEAEEVARKRIEARLLKARKDDEERA